MIGGREQALCASRRRSRTSELTGHLRQDVGRERLLQSRARAIQARAHGADAHAGDASDLLVGELAPGQQQDRLALLLAQGAERRGECRVALVQRVGVGGRGLRRQAAVGQTRRR
jgi:hypothetical protein